MFLLCRYRKIHTETRERSSVTLKVPSLYIIFPHFLRKDHFLAVFSQIYFFGQQFLWFWYFEFTTIKNPDKEKIENSLTSYGPSGIFLKIPWFFSGQEKSICKFHDSSYCNLGKLYADKKLEAFRKTATPKRQLKVTKHYKLVRRTQTKTLFWGFQTLSFFIHFHTINLKNRVWMWIPIYKPANSA